MVRSDSGRVAIFQSNWVVTSQTANAVVALADAGYAVDLFLCNSPRSRDYVDLDELKQRTNAEIHQLWTAGQTMPGGEAVPSANGSANHRPRFKSYLSSRLPVLNRARAWVRDTYLALLLRRGLAEGILMPGQVDRALQIMAGKRYRCVIGVEKKGLVWAGLVARRLHVPFIYHSLELYTDEGDYWRILTPDRFEFQCLRLGERLHHRHAAATIIQDPERAQVLLHDNGVDISKARVLYVPVSVLGERYPRRSRYLHDSLAIPESRKIILYFGHIWERRYVLELVQAAQRFPDDWLLVMHGPSDGSTVAKIKERDHRRKVVLSQRMVPSEQVPEVVSSADVGLLFYSGESHNERLTAFASEKMALYMQCGVPFIAFDYPGFRRLADEDRCGLVVHRLEELPEAIGKIMSNRDEFGQCAYRAFDEYYSFATSFAKVIEAIERL